MNASLCIVTYNNRHNIEAAIASIFEHTRSVDFTLYIVDNRSADGTAEFIEEKFPGVKLIRAEKNGGFGAGHNAVLPLLGSDYHFIVNPDIVLQNDIVGELCRFLEQSPDIVMAVPKFLHENGEEQFTPKLTPKLKYMLGGRLERFGGPFRRWRREYTLADREIGGTTDVGFCSGCFIAVRTEVFRKIGGFDERFFLYNEDADITRMAAAYGRTVYTPQFSVVHRWERAYMKKMKYFVIQISSMLKYFYKWRGNGKHIKNKTADDP